MKNKVIAFVLISIMLAGQPSIAAIKDIPRSHWSYSLSQELISEDIINSSDSFEMGKPTNYRLFMKMIDNIEANAKFKKQGKIELFKDNQYELTRLDAVKISIQYLGYDWLAQQLKNSNLKFNDVDSDKGYLQLALDFGIVSESSSFRPNDLLKQEEAIAFIYHINRLKSSDISSLHSYYAINSYSQIGMINKLDSLSFGWSRLEFSKVTNDVVLNSSSQNDNEYRVPTGYTEVVKATDAASIPKYLMVAVKDETVLNKELNKDVQLTDYILSDKAAMDRTISLITTMLDKNSQRIVYDGVLIDFESLSGEETAGKYNLFLSNLKIALNGGNKKLLVAVHPVRKAGIAYYDGYDYKSIGRLADYVILMAHDFYPKKLSKAEMQSGYTITPLVAINDLYYALKGITDPNTGVIDKSKIIVQFSMDSVQWKIKDGAIVNETPYHPTYSAISDRIKSGVAITYSDSMKSPYIIFEDGTDKTRNIVWYEDQRSMQSKIDLVKYFGISNTSIWRLGLISDNVDRPNETPQYLNIWNQFLMNLK